MAYIKLPWETGREIVLEGLQVKTDYQNTYPYNCGLCSNGVIYGDCWNMFPKSLIWSWALGMRLFKNRTNNTYFYNGATYGSYKSYNGIGASGLGDLDGGTIISLCDGGGSTNFSEIVPMELLYKAGHMAIYLGEFQWNGKTYNCMEYNAIDGVCDGINPFWIDATGVKYYYKGGYGYGTRFTKHGKLSKWIDYSNSEDEVPSHLNTQDLAVAICRGYIGKIYIGNDEERIKNLKALGYTEDEISKAQKLVDKIYRRYEYDKDCADDAMRFISNEAGDGEASRRAWLTKKYGTDDRFRDIQDKVNAYLKED